MIKHWIETRLRSALDSARGNLNNPEDASLESLLGSLKVERPRNAEHGDYAVNVAPLAKLTRMPPPKIAETLQPHLGNGQIQTQIIGAFVNFKLSDELLAQSLAEIIHAQAPGKNEALKQQQVLLEYVSANPTGPLHIGHGRWAALGDSINRVLEHCGATVATEFYINDAGVQADKIAFSVWWRAQEIITERENKLEAWKAGLGAREIPYPGEYVWQLAADYLQHPGKEEIIRGSELLFPADDTSLDIDDKTLADIKAFVLPKMLESQHQLLDKMGVRFDRWYSEADELHKAGKVEAAIQKLKLNGWLYEQEDALWFKSSAFGDEKDRVIRKSDDHFTYLAADIAYHDEKFSRQDAQGKPLYDKIINIWGADHHGYIPRMRAAIQALGHDPEKFEVLLGQLVNLIVEGEKTRMGKRRKMLTLEDVIEEVGVDATRFWMVSRSADTTLDFDVDLAASATDENPVFYVQYAHARCASILRNATREDIYHNQPPLTAQELEAFQQSASAETLLPLFTRLEDEKALHTLKALVLRLDGFSDLVKDAAHLRAPHLIARYTLDLSADFHSFYNVCRILTSDKELSKVRLMLIIALRRTLAQALQLLGVSAPDEM